MRLSNSACIYSRNKRSVLWCDRHQTLIGKAEDCFAQGGPADGKMGAQLLFDERFAGAELQSHDHGAQGVIDVVRQ
jgi:hypothetical protein